MGTRASLAIGGGSGTRELTGQWMEPGARRGRDEAQTEPCQPQNTDEEAAEGETGSESNVRVQGVRLTTTVVQTRLERRGSMWLVA